MDFKTQTKIFNEIVENVNSGLNAENAEFVMRYFMHFNYFWYYGNLRLVKELSTIFVYETDEEPEYGNNIYYLFKESGTAIKKGIFDSMINSIPRNVRDIPFYKECKKILPKEYCFFIKEDRVGNYFDRVPGRWEGDETDTRIIVRKDNKKIEIVKDQKIELLVEDMVQSCY